MAVVIVCMFHGERQGLHCLGQRAGQGLHGVEPFRDLTLELAGVHL